MASDSNSLIIADTNYPQTNPRGHVWKLYKPGLVEYYEQGGFHGGPWCARCDKMECEHCHPEFLTEDCPEFGNELPGLEMTNG